MTAIFQKLMRVDANYSRLVRLCNICEYDVHKRQKHAVFLGVTGILNYSYDVVRRNRKEMPEMRRTNNVGPFFGHVDQISP